MSIRRWASPPHRRGGAAAAVGAAVGGALVGAGLAVPRLGATSLGATAWATPRSTAEAAVKPPGPCAPVVNAAGTPEAGQWLQFGGGGERQDIGTSTTGTAGKLSVKWKTPQLDGAIYAQPLVSGKCLLVVTEDDSVYALEASTGKVVWHNHIASPVPGGDLPCGNINPSGITGTPVIDPATGVLWTVVFTTDGSGVVHELVGVDLSDGKILSRRDLVVPGVNPAAEQERSALGLSGGKVYVAMGGLYGDCNNYVGAVVSFPEKGGAPHYWKVPSSRGGGIWEPSGPAVLPDGDVLVSVGNGAALPGSPFDGSDSVIELSPQLVMTSYFAPKDWAQLDTTDGDLDSTGPAVLPGNLMFQIGKTGVGYLFAQPHLGGIGGQLAAAQVCGGGPYGGGYGSDAVSGYTIYVPCSGGLAAVKVDGHSLKLLWRSTAGGAGSPVVAAGRVFEETKAGTLYEVQPTTGTPEQALSLAAPVTDFAWLLPIGKTLYAPDGDAVAALGGL